MSHQANFFPLLDICNILCLTSTVYKTEATIAMMIVAQTGKPETAIKLLSLAMCTENVQVFIYISLLFNFTFYMSF